MKGNLLYAQSGGMTPVINATASALLEQAKATPEINKIYVGNNGIYGILLEELFDLTNITPDELELLARSPGGAFGSCRYKLPDYTKNKKVYERILEVFLSYNIKYFFYNGGNDSQDTVRKINDFLKVKNISDISCIGIPKTIDNDLYCTDNSPGFGTTAKYIATTVKEVCLDLFSMARTSSSVIVMEVMGRNAGWLAASSVLARVSKADGPHFILVPEVAFDQAKFVPKVLETVKQFGYCLIVVSEGLLSLNGEPVSSSTITDSFGHQKLGGVSHYLANLIEREGPKSRWINLDYAQRAGSHLTSNNDFLQATAIGKEAIKKAIAGKTGIMLTIERISSAPYQWTIGETALENVVLKEKKLPPEFIDTENFTIKDIAKEYFLPLIQGEKIPPFKDGLPSYIDVNYFNELVQKLAPYEI